jgi:uncharacterized protein (TIRG00374 family)
LRQIPRFLPHVVVFIFVAWCAYALRGDLAQVSLAPVLRSWDLFVLAAVFSLINYVLRIIRWRSYLARLGHPLGFRFAALTFVAGFAYTLSPGKVGEMVRARYYVPLGVPLAKTAAAFFAERLLDLVAMVVLAALLLAGSTQYRGAILGAAAVVAIALALFAGLPWERAGALVGSAQRIPRIVRNALVSLSSALAATRPLLRPAPLAFGFAIALVAWGLEGVGLGVLGGMLPGLHLDLPTATGIYAVAVLVGGLSFLPGGLGSTEAIMTTLLVTRGISVGDAVFVTLACRLVTLWLAVCLGWMAVLVLRQRPLEVASPWP